MTTGEDLQATTTAQSSSGKESSTEEPAKVPSDAMAQVRDPLFKLEQRPDVLDVLYADCIASQRGKGEPVDIYTTRP